MSTLNEAVNQLRNDLQTVYDAVQTVYDRKGWTFSGNKNVINLATIINRLGEVEPQIIIPDKYNNSYCFSKELIESQLFQTFSNIWKVSDMKKVLTDVMLKDVVLLDGCKFNQYGALSSLELNGMTASDTTNLIQNCTSLKSFSMEQLSACGNSFLKGSKTKPTPVQYINLPKLEVAGSSLCYNQTTLTGINLESIQYLGKEAFRECTNLISVSLPVLKTFPSGKSVTVGKVRNRTTRKLEITTRITGKENGTGGNGFRNCTALTCIDMPNVTYFQGNQFSGCSNLQKLILTSSNLSSFKGPISIQKHCATALTVDMSGKLNMDEGTFKDQAKTLNKTIILSNIMVKDISNAIQTVYIKTGITDVDLLEKLNDVTTLKKTFKLSNWAAGRKNFKIQFIT